MSDELYTEELVGEDLHTAEESDALICEDCGIEDRNLRWFWQKVEKDSSKIICEKCRYTYKEIE